MSEDVENDTCPGGQAVKQLRFPLADLKGKAQQHSPRTLDLDPNVLGCRVPTPTGVNPCIRVAGLEHHSAPVMEPAARAYCMTWHNRTALPDTKWASLVVIYNL